MTAMGAGGVVFDIQRSSLHDGPGIRTTVFLKGCTARCPWCHNPESIPFAPLLSFDAETCRLCRACAAVCTESVHSFDESGHHVDFDACTLCGRCVPACPEGCLRIVGRTCSVEEIVAEVVKDRPFYERSGGGLTVSGGEPTAQIDFACALAAEARARGIHTCIDTAGGGRQEDLARLLPITDLFLFDYKDSDTVRLRANTGLHRDAVESNLRFLVDSGAAVVLRCPVIPGINDTQEHFLALVSIGRRYPRLKGIELLPYHNLGVHKARRIGREARLSGLATTAPETTAHWRTLVAELGGRGITVA